MTRAARSQARDTLLDGGAIDRLGGAIFERFGRLDIWVQAAATMGAEGLTPVSHADPRGFAKVVLVAGDIVTVCFSAPVCELLSHGQVLTHPSMSKLGPDALDDDEAADALAGLLELDLEDPGGVGGELDDRRLARGHVLLEVLIERHVAIAGAVVDVCGVGAASEHEKRSEAHEGLACTHLDMMPWPDRARVVQSDGNPTATSANHSSGTSSHSCRSRS